MFLLIFLFLTLSSISVHSAAKDKMFKSPDDIAENNSNQEKYVDPNGIRDGRIIFFPPIPLPGIRPRPPPPANLSCPSTCCAFACRTNDNEDCPPFPPTEAPACESRPPGSSPAYTRCYLTNTSTPPSAMCSGCSTSNFPSNCDRPCTTTDKVCT